LKVVIQGFVLASLALTAGYPLPACGAELNTKHSITLRKISEERQLLGFL
jgi:hypothetical protein